jgi:hypothetical protein
MIFFIENKFISDFEAKILRGPLLKENHFNQHNKKAALV